MLEILIVTLLIVFSLAGIFYPLFGLYAFFIIAYIRPQDYYTYLVGIEPAKWIIIITFISFVFQGMRTRVKFINAKQNWGILGILLAIFISRMNVVNPNLWWGSTVDFIVVCLIYFLMINLLTNFKLLRKFYLFFILINLIVAVRFYIGYETGTAGYAGGKPGDTSLGFLGNADDLGLGLAVALAYTLLPIFYKKSFILKVFYSIISVFLMIMALNTGSRGAAIGIFTVFISSIILQLKRSKLQFKKFSTGLLLVLVIFLLFTYKYRYTLSDYSDTAQDQTDTGRVGRNAAWIAAKQMIHDNPIFGVGRGNFVPYWRENYPPGIYGYQVAHNIIYEVTAEIGIVGLLFFFFFSLIGLKELGILHQRYQAKLRENDFFDMIFAICLVGIIGFYANGMFITVAFYWHIYILVAFFVCAKNVFLNEVVQKNEFRKIK